MLKKCIPPRFFLRLWYHKAKAVVACMRYGFPAKSLRVIGVTGTDGKTTTCLLMAHMLEHLGEKVGVATTQSFGIGKEKWVNETHKTTMAPFALQKLLKRMKEEQCTVVVMEVSSHGIDQNRFWGIPFIRGVFTNLSREHLDYHVTMEDYARTKARLFEEVRKQKGIGIINAEDEEGERMKKASGRAITYGQERGDVHLERAEYVPGGMVLTIVHGNAKETLKTSLLGDGNQYNILAALTVGVSLGYTLAQTVHALEGFAGVPGRMELVGEQVYIDYAVTPKALESLYKTARKFTEGKIIAILGACGDRDQGKRPQLGELAGHYTDIVILTNEEPYTEDPEQIVAMLREGVERTEKREGVDFFACPDRREAIEKAITLMEKEDTVLLTGMGDQRSMIIGTKKVPWSDREVVRSVLERTGKKGK